MLDYAGSLIAVTGGLTVSHYAGSFANLARIRACVRFTGRRPLVAHDWREAPIALDGATHVGGFAIK
jgi:hypothetical protein